VTAQGREPGRTFTTETPPGVLRYPEPEVSFPMRHVDWKRVRARAGTLADPVPYFGQVGWTFAGIGITALLTLAPWIPAYSALSPSARLTYAWVTPLLACVGAFSAALAGFCMWASHKMRGREKVTLQSVLDDMDDVYAPHDPEKQIVAPPVG
jgi:hypothetical protein